MAPSYENLPMDEDMDEEEIDFTDLQEQFEVRLEEGLDTFVVIDGLPVVAEESKQKLIKFLVRKLNTVGKAKEEGIFMPVNDKNLTQGFAFVEFASAEQAAAVVKQLHGTPLDKKHTIAVNKLTDIDRYGREGRIDDEYDPPKIEPFTGVEHLRWWLGDTEGRDQFAMLRSDNVGVFWNDRDEAPEPIVDRQHWTESFVQWSPLGTFLTSMHAQGVQLWGGKSWGRQKRFAHPGVNLVDFSPGEKYITTWSHQPIEVDENHPILSFEEDGKNYIIWDIETTKPLRSFVTIEAPGPSVDELGNPIKKKLQWPAFKWSADDNFVARMTQGQSIHVYELPKMNLLDKSAIKVEGIEDFEWAPDTTQRDGIKGYEQLLCFWSPEIGANPAKVGLMTLPTKEIIRTRNLFNVSDAKLHWQSQAAYVCIKVDRHSKSKKPKATNLEIFRVQEKGVPVEVVDAIKDQVINFAWEPKGDRFVLITTSELPTATAVPPKTSVSFFAPERAKGPAVGNFKLIRTIEKKNSNAIYWSPRGRFVVVGAVHTQQSYDLDFWDLDFEGEREDKDKDLAANLQLMATVDHYGVTDIEWDPTGRFVATSASMWKHAVENGYHLYDFRGTLLREEPTERFKQFAWRPRPPSLLSKDEQKRIRKNLREYSRVFDEADLAKKDSASRAVVELRRRLLDEWRAWREETVEEAGMAGRLAEDGEAEDGDGDDAGEKEADGKDGGANATETIEEIVEEIVDETEEVIG